MHLIHTHIAHLAFTAVRICVQTCALLGEGRTALTFTLLTCPGPPPLSTRSRLCIVRNCCAHQRVHSPAPFIQRKYFRENSHLEILMMLGQKRHVQFQFQQHYRRCLCFAQSDASPFLLNCFETLHNISNHSQLIGLFV